MKMANFQGDQPDISAEKEALHRTNAMVLTVPLKLGLCLGHHVTLTI